MDGHLIHGSKYVNFKKRDNVSPHTLIQLSRQYGNKTFLMKSFHFLLGCKHALNDSFGHLNITYNGRFSPDCIWTLGNSGISEPVAIVSIEDVQFGYCR